MRRITKWVSLFVCGVLSFLFFLYISFPYDVLKESLSVRLSESLGLSLHIDEISPNLPLGLHIKGLDIAAPGGKSFRWDHVRAKVSMWSLFMGRLAFWSEIIDSEKGGLELGASISVWSVLTDGLTIPNRFSLESHAFHFGPVIEFFLSQKSKSPDTDMMLKPILEKISVQGLCDAAVEVDVNTSDYAQSHGSMAVDFKKMQLNFDSSLQIPNQSFDKASIKAHLSNGVFQFDPTSSLQSKDLLLSISGKITQKPQIEKSLVEIDLDVSLEEALKAQFGFILDAMAKRTTEGKIQIKMTGALSPQPQITIL